MWENPPQRLTPCPHNPLPSEAIHVECYLTKLLGLGTRLQEQSHPISRTSAAEMTQNANWTNADSSEG